MEEKKDFMKNILLLHPIVLFYKVPIYNKLAFALKEQGYNLIIWAPEIQNKNEEVYFEMIANKMNLLNYKNILKSKNIDTVVNILFPSKPGYLFYLLSILFAKLYNKKIIYYGHGINLEKSDNAILKFIYNIVHFSFNKIILYTPNEKKYLWKIHHKKVFIAYNTLDLSGREKLITNSRMKIRKKYYLDESLVILFSGRIQERKRLDLLISVFEKFLETKKNIKMIIVGPGLRNNLKQQIEKMDNVTYLGPIYSNTIMAELFYASDVYCIPGHIGLGLIEAFYWGKPVVTMDVKHAPEIYYLKSGINGYIANSTNELSSIISKLLKDKTLLNQWSRNARQTYESKANISRMINGFVKAIKE